VKALFKNGSKAGRAAMKQSARATRAARSQLDNLGSKTRKLRRSSNEATETTTRTLRCGCFTAGTAVVMADGQARAIDQIETGDTVVGRDGDTGADQPGQVTNTLTREQAPTLVVSTTAGDITTTAEHPFWVGDHWVAAGDLEAGHQLESQDGTPVTVTALTPTLDVATVYNLTIADLHTYYIQAGDSGGAASDTGRAVLVHNGAGPCGVSQFSQLTHSGQGIAPYREQRLLTRGSGRATEAHHLIEKRFRKAMGGDPDDWMSVVLTRDEHRVFTNAWRAEIGYGVGTRRSNRMVVNEAARRIYANYPEFLHALGL
jgi:hypothetical protein